MQLGAFPPFFGCVDLEVSSFDGGSGRGGFASWRFGCELSPITDWSLRSATAPIFLHDWRYRLCASRFGVHVEVGIKGFADAISNLIRYHAWPPLPAPKIFST